MTTPFTYGDPLPLGHEDTPWRKLDLPAPETFSAGGHTFLKVDPAALTVLAREAMRDISHLLRPGHLGQLRAILDDASASAQCTTLGLGTTDSPQFAKVILQNGEFIENTVDGDVHIMPAPDNSNFVGLRFQFNWAFDTVRIGTRRSLTGTNDDGRVQWLVPLQVFDNINMIFGDSSRSAIRQAQGSSRPQTLQIGVNAVDIVGVENDSNHALVLCNYGHLGNAARMPSTLYNDPSFLVYSADIAQADDFARLTHDQTDGLLESGNGKMRIKGASVVRIEGPSGGFDLPATAGSVGQVLTTDGTNASWATPTSGGLSEDDAVALEVAL